MGNVQIVWILYAIVLSLNFSTAKRHWIIKPARVNQPICFKDTLASKFKSKDVLIWGRRYAFNSAGNEWLWIHFKLKKIRFD